MKKADFGHVHDIYKENSQFVLEHYKNDYIPT